METSEAAEKNSSNRSKYLRYLKIAAIYLVITLILFWPLTLNLTTTVVNGSGDVFQTMWNLWWVNYSLFVLHTSPYYTNLLYYPVGASLATQTLTPIAGIISAPFQFVSLPFAYNIIFFLDFALAGLFMYLLADHITNNKYAAFLAGLIFAFSPMHVAQSYGHLNWTTIEFLPLYILFFLKMIEHKKFSLKYAAIAAVSFILLTFMGDVEQGIITVVLTFFLLLYYLATKRRSSVLNKGFAASFGAMILLIAIIGSPFFLSILYGINHYGALASASQQSSVQYNEIWSQSILSYIVPSSFNNQFSNLSAGSGSIFSPDPTERTAYIGIIAAILAAVGIAYDWKKEHLSKAAPWLFIGIIFLWLSLGPYIQFSTASSVSSVPGLYLLYSKVPLFNLVREPGRFDLIFTVALSILAAIGAKEIFDHEKIKGISKSNMATYLTVGLGIIILIEYVGITTPAFAHAMFINAQIPLGYKELGALKGNFTVMVLPNLPNITYPALYPGMAEYYQSAFHQPMVGGYTSRTNSTQLLTAEVIPLSLSSLYLEEGYGFIYPSPILENVSNANLLLLAEYNIHFVGASRSAYNTSSLSVLYNYLYSLFGVPVYQDNTTIIFSTSNALTQNVGKHLVAYTTFPWTPGFSLCPSPYNCNATLASMWWGPQARGMMIFAPANQTNVTMRFSAMSYGAPSRLEMILNTPQNIIDEENLNTTPQGYTINMTLRQGLNELVFYGQSAYVNESNTTINYGIENITVNATK